MRERARARACESGASVFQCAGAVSFVRSCLVPTLFDTLSEDFLPQGVEHFSGTEGVPGVAGD